MIKYIIVLLFLTCIQGSPLKITKVCSEVNENKNFLYVVDVVNYSEERSNLRIECWLENCSYIICSEEPESQNSEDNWYRKPDTLQWSRKKITTGESIRLLFVIDGLRNKVFPSIHFTITQNNEIVQCSTKNTTMQANDLENYLVELPYSTRRLFRNYLTWHSLLIKECAPKKADLEEEILCKVHLRHSGNEINDVVLHYNIDSGYKYLGTSLKPRKKRNNQLTWKWKTLKRDIFLTIKLKVKKRGILCNNISVKCFECPTQKAVSIVRVDRRKFNKYSLSIEGPKNCYISRRFMVNVIVNNQENTVLQNFQVICSTTKDFIIISGSHSPKISGSKIKWHIDYLAGYDQVSFTFSVVVKKHKSFFVEGKLMKRDLLLAENIAWVNCRGFSSLLLEVIDTVDPLLVVEEEETSYVIEVTNCFHTDYQLIITAVFPDGLIPLEVTGDTIGHIVENRYVYFEAYPKLHMKEKIRFIVKAKGVKRGDMRLKVYLFSRDLVSPIIEEESTHAY
ncbi:hypothetical protein [Candidatus Uabimicrobium sp. HlEnr_7]|uniref:hypothetical protein n=1 Tax=Candidatus Uabimicrobium helgolandensis TaxID=3095367 RepID=UPI003558A659